MNEWLKRMTEAAGNFWKNSSAVRKIIIIGAAAVIILAVIVTTRVSSRPTSVRLFSSPVRDETARTKILDRIDRENISAEETADGYIMVADERTKRKLISILTSENLVPGDIDQWGEYYNRSWSATDAEQNERLKNLITQEVKKSLEVFDDIEFANVTIVQPKRELFAADQNPVSASVILKLKPNSSLATDRNRILGIQRIMLSAVEGLREENLTISDTAGVVLNDFEGMAETDRLNNIEKQQKLRRKWEAETGTKVLNALQKTLTEDRVRDLVVTLEWDMSEESSDATVYSPIEIKKDNPDTPYDDSEYRDTLPISQQTVTKEWQGTGYNPEGPAGTEGQTPPVYSDMSNVVGKSVETGVTQNNALNTRRVTRNESFQPGRRTVSVNVDGTWSLVLDPKTHGNVVDEETGGLKRVYTPVSEDVMNQLRASVRAAAGYNRDRGDLVEVTNIPFDRTEEFAAYDAEYFRQEQQRRTVLLVLLAVTVVLIGFIVFRLISKEMERRRRLREEELLRQQQAAREQALWDAKEDGMQVTMSVEESHRAELQENAINIAKEHPEDVAMLIRTWLMEE